MHAPTVHIRGIMKRGWSRVDCVSMNKICCVIERRGMEFISDNDNIKGGGVGTFMRGYCPGSLFGIVL